MGMVRDIGQILLILVYKLIAERLNLQSLMSYLISDDNVVLNPEGADQHMDMSQPLNYYFINSSHNTYLNGTSEYYLLLLINIFSRWSTEE